MVDTKAWWNLVKKENLCFNCLGKHKASECSSKHSRRKCQRGHYTSVCNNIESIRKETKSNGTKDDNVPILHTSNQQNKAVFWKTAVAPVWSLTQCDDANVLFDEGAQRSFIKQDLADRLNAKSEGGKGSVKHCCIW